MKKYALLLVSFSTLLGCIINPIPVAEKTPEKINILSKVQPKMEYPYDIEVTKDGKTIYFKNLYQFPDSNIWSNYNMYNDVLDLKKIIYKLDVKTKQITLFKINDNYFSYNNLGYQMEIDNDGNLYVDSFINKIDNIYSEDIVYKINSSGMVSNSYYIYSRKELLSFDKNNSSSYFYNFGGPNSLFLKDKKLSYDIVIKDNKIENNKIKIIKLLNIDTKEESSIASYKLNEFGLDVNNPFLVINNKIIHNHFYEDKLSIYETKNNVYDTTSFINKNNPSFNIINVSKSLNLFYYYNQTSPKSDSKNNIFIPKLNRIYKYNLEEKEFEIIGDYNINIKYKDGNKKEALFYYPMSLSIDENDNIYVADTGNNAIRKITPDGIVSTLYKEL